MTVIPGEPLGGSLTDEQLDALGDALGTLWSIPPHDLPPIDIQALIDRTLGSLPVLRAGNGVFSWYDVSPSSRTASVQRAVSGRRSG